MRQATCTRKTRETEITVSVNLDGQGIYDVKTGIGFLDHMMAQLSRHSLIDLIIHARGDLHIDGHHTVEDVGIILGQALRQALGDYCGISRYGAALIPMDECCSRAAVDISGRPFLVWKVDFSREKLGDMECELFQEWFRAFAFGAGITLHVENIYGENNHHIIESAFKAVARALRQAVAIDARAAGALPSTKGVIGDMSEGA